MNESNQNWQFFIKTDEHCHAVMESNKNYRIFRKLIDLTRTAQYNIKEFKFNRIGRSFRQNDKTWQKMTESSKNLTRIYEFNITSLNLLKTGRFQINTKFLEKRMIDLNPNWWYVNDNRIQISERIWMNSNSESKPNW